MHIVTTGIVLRETAYKETDKILTLLTREGGKLTASARACRKNNSPLAASTQLLVHAEFTLAEFQDRWSVTEAASLNQFWGVRREIEKLALASYFAEVTELVAEEGVADSPLLPLLLNALYALDQMQKPLALVKAAFELKLLCLVGYEPILDACALCGAAQPKAPCLDLVEGVLCCGACHGGEGEALALDAASLAAMRHVACGDPKKLFSFPIDADGMQKMSAACEGFLTTQLEKSFRTLEFYRDLMAGRN